MLLKLSHCGLGIGPRLNVGILTKEADQIILADIPAGRHFHAVDHKILVVKSKLDIEPFNEKYDCIVLNVDGKPSQVQLNETKDVPCFVVNAHKRFGVDKVLEWIRTKLTERKWTYADQQKSLTSPVDFLLSALDEKMHRSMENPQYSANIVSWTTNPLGDVYIILLLYCRDVQEISKYYRIIKTELSIEMENFLDTKVSIQIFTVPIDDPQNKVTK